MRHNEHEDEDMEPVDLSRGTFAMRPETIVRSLWIICGIMVTGTVAVMSQLYALRGSIEDLNRKIDARTSDRWTLSMEREELNQLQRDNPMFHSPDADAIWAKIRPWDSPR